MKAKTIKKLLNKKHDEFVKSIEDNEVKELVRKNAIITGGSIVSMLLNEPVNDYDYYFTDKETTLKVAKYFVEKFKENHNNGLDIYVKDDDGKIKIVVQSQGIAGEEVGHEVDDDEITEEKEEAEETKTYKPVFLSANAISLTGKIQLVLRFYGDADISIHALNTESDCEILTKLSISYYI